MLHLKTLRSLGYAQTATETIVRILNSKEHLNTDDLDLLIGATKRVVTQLETAQLIEQRNRKD